MHRLWLIMLTACLSLGAGSLAARAQEQSERAAQLQPEPMVLGVSAAFGQGNPGAIWDGLESFDLHQFRAGLRWSEIETRAGHYRFGRPRHNYPDRLHRRGSDLVLTLNFGNPLYDAGHTPHSPAALAAFGQFAAAMVERFPAITVVEIGNEFNGPDFVTGPVKEAGLQARGAYHLAMLRSAALAIRAVRPQVQILGGSTHSIPAGYLWPILDAGGAQYMDGLAIHPYSTPIDQLPAQIGVLRRHPLMREMPIWVTEAGSKDAQRAPDDLLKAYTTMAALGFRALYWYPLSDRGDGMAPLLDAAGRPTAAGTAYAFVRQNLLGRLVRNVSPDAFTVVHRIGDDMAIVWGEPRALHVKASDVAAFDALGQPLDTARLALSRAAPIILHAASAIDPERDLAMGCHDLVADTRDQFTFPPDAEAGFARRLRIGGAERGFATLPGQQRGGTPWTPYLGLADRLSLRLTATNMIPTGRPADKLAIIHRFVADAPMRLQLKATLDVAQRSTDGIDLVIAHAARPIHSANGAREVRFTQELALAKGDTLSISVSGGNDHRGDNVRYHYQLRDLERCAN